MKKNTFLLFILVVFLIPCLAFSAQFYPGSIEFNHFGDRRTNSLASFDANSDGDLDVAVANMHDSFGNPEANELYLNDGFAHFTGVSAFNQFGNRYSTSLVVFDADGDGDLDVGVGNAYDLVIPPPPGQPNELYFNDGSGNFTGVAEFNDFGGRWTYALAAFDADSDGDLDVAVGNTHNESNELYLNDGLGNFTGAIEFNDFGNRYTYSLVVFDAEGDGDLDVAVGNWGQNELYLNDGSGNFTGQTEFENGDCFSIIDFDAEKDGDLDVAVANFYTSSLPNMLYLNDGSGNFTGRTEFDEFGGRHTYSLISFDAEGDGDMDVAVGNHQRTNEFYENDGSGNFTGFTEFNDFGNRDTVDLIAFDADGDGKMDVAVGNYGSGNELYISEYIATPTPTPSVTPTPITPTPSVTPTPLC